MLKKTTESSSMPHLIKPMMAKTIQKPFDSPSWVFEIKWDGYRAIAEINRGRISLYSRNLLSFNDRFPIIVQELKEIKGRLILDGEIVSLDEEGRARFENLQQYQLNKKRPIVYICFDLLFIDGKDLRELPLILRKEKLHSILPESNIIKYSDHIEEKGIKYFSIAKQVGLEGIIAKEKDSPYLTGRRSDYWLKIKALNQEEAIICGYTEPQGGRKYFGSLVLGTYQNNKLVYVGNVGTGFDDKLLENLYFRFQEYLIKSSPFEKTPKIKAQWLRPILVCEIRFTEITSEGLYRHPVFLGLREDKLPNEVVR